MSIPAYMWKFFQSQFKTITDGSDSFEGQTVIVTGSNTGLGLEAARYITHHNATKLILAVRDLTKGESARQNILRTTKTDSSTLEVWHLDMSSPSSIQNFAHRASELHRLDAACLNAGVMMSSWREVNGVESHVATNLVGSFLLACLLLPKLQASARQTGSRGRLSFVGTDVVFVADLRELRTEGGIWKKLNDREQSEGWLWQRYQISKLLLFYSCQRLAELFPLDDTDCNVLINIMTPGLCRSSIMRDSSSIGQLGVSFLYATLGRTTETGGMLLAHAIGPGLSSEAHGKFLMDKEVTSVGSPVEGEEARRLAGKWNAEFRTKLEEMVPGCTKIEGRQF